MRNRVNVLAEVDSSYLRRDQIAQILSTVPIDVVNDRVSRDHSDRFPDRRTGKNEFEVGVDGVNSYHVWPHTYWTSYRGQREEEDDTVFIPSYKRDSQGDLVEHTVVGSIKTRYRFEFH